MPTSFVRRRRIHIFRGSPQCQQYSIPGMYGFGKPESGHMPPMLLGFEDAHGTLATNLPGRQTGLSAHGGGGSGVHNRTGLVLAPVPPPGEPQVHFAWPHFGIDETKHVLDAGEFVSAAEQVVTLWDEVDPAAAAQIDINDRTIPEIEIPSAGWFASAFELQKPPPPDPHAPQRMNFAFVRQDSPNE